MIIAACGRNINLTPRSARAPTGERACGSVPRNTNKNTTLLAAMTTAGRGPAMLLEGATDTAACEAYVEQFLVPALAPGKIGVLDHLSAHKSPRVQTLIEAQGGEVCF